MSQLNIFNIFKQEEPAGDTSHWKLFVDGASRNNPGLSGAGLYILKDSAAFDRKGFFLGVRTNNQAEYLGLLLGLFFLQDKVQGDDDLYVISDSLLLVKQLQGAWRVKNPGLKPLHALATIMMKKLNGRVGHVLREDNKEADAMANYGIDKKVKVPEAFITMLKKHEIQW